MLRDYVVMTQLVTWTHRVYAAWLCRHHAAWITWTNRVYGAWLWRHHAGNDVNTKGLWCVIMSSSRREWREHKGFMVRDYVVITQWMTWTQRVYGAWLCRHHAVNDVNTKGLWCVIMSPSRSEWREHTGSMVRDYVVITQGMTWTQRVYGAWLWRHHAGNDVNTQGLRCVIMSPSRSEWREHKWSMVRNYDDITHWVHVNTHGLWSVIMTSWHSELTWKQRLFCVIMSSSQNEKR